MRPTVKRERTPVETAQQIVTSRAAAPVSSAHGRSHAERLNDRTTSETPGGPEHRFWSRVRAVGACWEWTGATIRAGSPYGRLRWGHQLMLSHRLAWQLSNGPIPAGLYVCHHCDNPPCVRPDHLFLGTHEENMRDACSKRRLRGPALGPHRIPALAPDVTRPDFAQTGANFTKWAIEMARANDGRGPRRGPR